MKERDLSVLVLILSAIVFVVVGGLIAYNVARFRAPSKDPGTEPPQVYGSAQVEAAWTVVPLLIVMVLMLSTARVIHEVQAAPQPPNDEPKRRSRLGLILAVLGLVALLGVVGWWETQRPNRPIAIAVLPFENVSHDPANDYFADGLTDELIRNPSIIDGLSPRSRTSSFAFKGKPRNVREAGNELAADYILEGSVLRAGQQLRINAQLIRVRDDFPIWSGKFDRELTDVFAIQDEISRGIVNSLRLKLGGGRRRYETSVEAYDSYLRARAFENGSGDIDPSIGLFEEAVAKDSSFAPAYAGLAAAYAYTSATFPNLDHRDDQLVENASGGREGD